MNPKNLAHLVIKLQGAAFLVSAVIDCTYLPQYYRAAHTIREVAGLNEAAAQNLTMATLRVGLYFFASLVFFAATEKISGFFSESGKHDSKQ